MVLTEAGLPLPRPCTQLVLLERPVVEVAPQATPGLAQEQPADSRPFRLRGTCGLVSVAHSLPLLYPGGWN